VSHNEFCTVVCSVPHFVMINISYGISDHSAVQYRRMEEDEDSFILIKVTVRWEGGFGRFELPLRNLLLRLFRRGYQVATIHAVDGTMDGVELGLRVSDQFLENTGAWRLVAMIPQGEE